MSDNNALLGRLKKNLFILNACKTKTTGKFHRIPLFAKNYDNLSQTRDAPSL